MILSQQRTTPGEVQVAVSRQLARTAAAALRQVHAYDQTGKVDVSCASVADESTVSVTFVNTFTEEPTFTFGFAMAPNNYVTAGSFPTASVFVLNWVTAINGPQISYLGATLGIVTTGTAGQQLIIHYSFRGNAMSFPAPAAPSNTTGNA